MGRVVACEAAYGGEASAGTAMLEGDHLAFRGKFRVKISFAAIISLAVSGDTLTVKDGAGTLSLALGPAASAWAEKIRRPPSRAEKLGIRPGLRVRTVGIADADFGAELAATTTATTELEIVFVGANSVADLAQLAAVKATLATTGALWVVYPKARPEIRESHVRAAGRGIGCKDVKVVAFSATHTALKFVVPRSLTPS